MVTKTARTRQPTREMQRRCRRKRRAKMVRRLLYAAAVLLVAVAVALFLSCGEKEYAFLEKEPLEVPPERSCVIWTVSGVLFGAVMTVMRLLNRKNNPPRGFSQKARRSVTSGPSFVFRQLLFTS